MNPSVAIIAAQRECRLQLQSTVSRHLKLRQVQAIMQTFPSWDEFLLSYHPGDHSIVLIDIDMGDKDGLRLAQRIRDNADQCQIVLIARDASDALRGYEMDATGFIVKPIQTSKLDQALDRCLRHLRIPPSIEVIANRLPTRVSLDSILWLNTYRNTIIIHTDAGQIRTYMTFERIKDLLQQADPEGRFLVCYTGCLVNMDRVRSMGENDFIMVNGDHVQIRRRGCGLIRRAYVQYRCGMRDVATAGFRQVMPQPMDVFIASS